MAIEDLRVIGNVLYERRSDGLLYPVRQVAGQNPAQSEPQAPQGLLSGIPELGSMVNKLGLLNQTFNPVEGIGQSMDASRRMLASDTSTMDRIAALGDMLSGIAGVTAPVAAAARVGTPAAVALMEGLLGGSPTMSAVGDTARSVARTVAERANQRGPVPVMGSNFANLFGDVGEASTGIRAYQGSPHNFAAERLVRMPDGSTQYIVGRPDVLPDVPAGAEVLRDFPLGRMRMDKIGTGEGNQAFGRGLYTAENEGIARSYRDQLSRPYLATPDGQSIAEKYGIDVADIFENAAGDPKDLRDTVLRLRKIVKQNLDDIGASDVSELKPEFNGDLASTIIEFSNRADRLENLMNSGDVKLVNEGKIYEVSINAKPDDFINYDAPLSAQGQKVKEQFGYTPKPTPGEEIAAYELAKREAPNNIGEHPAVQDIYRRESAANAAERLFQSKVQGGGVDEAARIGLSQAGIPGIRYFDAGSRYTPSNLPNNPIANEARTFLDQASGDAKMALRLFNGSNPVERFASGERDEVRKVIEAAGRTATRNYVVFDDNLISIVRKYGIAGAAAMLGVGAVDVEEAMARGQQQPPQGLLSMGSK